MKIERMCWTCGKMRAQKIEMSRSGSVYVCETCGTTRLTNSVADEAHNEIPPPHSGEASNKIRDKAGNESSNAEDQPNNT